MRKSKLTAADIEAAEQAADSRRTARNQGFSLMEIRDRGWMEIANGAIVEWPTDTELTEYVPRRIIPEGHFVINMGKESALFDADDFRKVLRWV